MCHLRPRLRTCPLTRTSLRDYKRTESILDRVVNGAHHIHMPGRSYRPNHRPTTKAGT